MHCHHSLTRSVIVFTLLVSSVLFNTNTNKLLVFADNRYWYWQPQWFSKQQVLSCVLTTLNNVASSNMTFLPFSSFNRDQGQKSKRDFRMTLTPKGYSMQVTWERPDSHVCCCCSRVVCWKYFTFPSSACFGACFCSIIERFRVKFTANGRIKLRISQTGKWADKNSLKRL